MNILGIDIGGTKLAIAVFSQSGDILIKEVILIRNLKGDEIGSIVREKIRHQISGAGSCWDIGSIGISVPGIYNKRKGTVWAPNIEGWEEYPLLDSARGESAGLPVIIDSDRACSVFGEKWKGSAAGCRNMVFLAIGTGIGAGILADGKLIRGRDDIAGAIGWMSVERSFDRKYSSCGCFEYYASGDGLARAVKDSLSKDSSYAGALKKLPPEKITSFDVFSAYDSGDSLAKDVIRNSIESWGMAVANIISILNPEKVILGGGLFGPAVKFIPDIIKEARKWAQPVAIRRAEILASQLGADAAIYGAAFLALRNMMKKRK